MKFTVKLLEKILVLTAVAAVATFADDSEMSSGEGLDDNILPTNNTDIVTVSDDGKVFQELELFSERKSRCSPTIACTRAGGQCVKSKIKCNGVLVPSDCKRGEKCKCCMPNNLERKVNILYDKLDYIIDDMKRNTNSLEDKLIYIIAFLNNSLESEDTTTPIPTTTTIAPTTTDPGCPDGFFRIEGSLKCFKYFNDQHLDWPASKSKCIANGLLLAMPHDPVAMAIYLQNTYGDGDGQPWAYVDAKGDGSVLRWQRNNEVISNSSPLWYPGHPSSRVTTNYCICLLNQSTNVRDHPGKPYYASPCTATDRYPLCEME